MCASHLWVVVLAAGEGRRLSALTSNGQGVSVPKQFCSFGRDRPMVQWALDRARSLAPVDRIVVVVASEQRSWWEPEVSELPRRNVLVQPRNRGTAAGILFPLVEVLKRDPQATIVIVPSDHHVEDEETLRGAIERAADAVRARPEHVVLLGITPEEVETEYGWILPGSRGRGTRPVERFIEKPRPDVAAELLLRGAVWNSFILVASGKTLLHAYAKTVSDVLDPFLRELVVMPRPQGLEELYDALPSRDFSRDVLERLPERLEVLVVPPCGWTDLGTPPRLRRFLERHGRVDRRPLSAALPA